MAYNIQVEKRNKKYNLNEFITITNVTKNSTSNFDVKKVEYLTANGGVVRSKKFNSKEIVIEFVIVGDVNKKKEQLLKCLPFDNVENFVFSDESDRIYKLEMFSGVNIDVLSKTFARGTFTLLSTYPFSFSSTEKTITATSSKTFNFVNKGTAPLHPSITVELTSDTTMLGVVSQGKAVQIGKEGGSNIGTTGDKITFNMLDKTVNKLTPKGVTTKLYANPLSSWFDIPVMTDKEVQSGNSFTVEIAVNSKAKVPKGKATFREEYL